MADKVKAYCSCGQVYESEVHLIGDIVRYDPCSRCLEMPAMIEREPSATELERYRNEQR